MDIKKIPLSLSLIFAILAAVALSHFDILPVLPLTGPNCDRLDSPQREYCQAKQEGESNADGE